MQRGHVNFFVHLADDGEVSQLHQLVRAILLGDAFLSNEQVSIEVLVFGLAVVDNCRWHSNA